MITDRLDSVFTSNNYSDTHCTSEEVSTYLTDLLHSAGAELDVIA